MLRSSDQRAEEQKILSVVIREVLSHTTKATTLT